MGNTEKAALFRKFSFMNDERRFPVGKRASVEKRGRSGLPRAAAKGPLLSKKADDQ